MTYKEEEEVHVVEITPNARQHALEVLGLSGLPTEAEVTAAYRRRARDTHPDTADSAHPVSEFHAVLEAYRLLSDQHQADIEASARQRRRPAPPPRATSEVFARRRSQSPEIAAGPTLHTPPPNVARRVRHA